MLLTDSTVYSQRPFDGRCSRVLCIYAAATSSALNTAALPSRPNRPIRSRLLTWVRSYSNAARSLTKHIVSTSDLPSSVN